MNNKYIAIMAGGIGSRFWPSSTASNPKQFIDILGIGKSLIRMTFERSAKVVPVENILIVTNKRYKKLVKQHIPELPERNILCEPSMNNTAPCVAYTALRIQSENPDAVFAVLPSDHVVLKEREYIAYLNQAFSFAEENESIVTLGIKPTRPDTGYGYIKVGCTCIDDNDLSNQDTSVGFCRVESFREKPDKKTAQEYLDLSLIHICLLESAYRECLKYELEKEGLNVKAELGLPLVYKEVRLNQGYRIDLLVNDAIVVELKTVEVLSPVHKAQLLTYLKLGNYKLGILINFHTKLLKEGIIRYIN